MNTNIFAWFNGVQMDAFGSRADAESRCVRLASYMRKHVKGAFPCNLEAFADLLSDETAFQMELGVQLLHLTEQEVLGLVSLLNIAMDAIKSDLGDDVVRAMLRASPVYKTIVSHLDY